MADAPPIRFTFNERKATAAAALILDLDGGVMDYMRLVKLLYFAEREAFLRLGRPITRDLYFSLDDGPILSTVLDLCKGRQFSRVWTEMITKAGRWAVGLRQGLKPQDLGPLSEAEIQILRSISDRHKDDDQWALSKIAHTEFSEWKDPHGGRLPIEPDEMMRALGISTSAINELREEAQYDANLDKLFGVF